LDEGALFTAIEEMRAIEAEARTSTRTTRRQRARRLGLRVIEEPKPVASPTSPAWSGDVVEPGAPLKPFDVEEW
jgi:putative transposase